MNEIMKMVKFDYSIVKEVGSKYVWIFTIICAVLCIVGMFPVALGFLIFPMGLFSPLQTFRKGDFMKIYGVLPVKREYITRALFYEIAVPQLIGGVLCEIFLFISKAIGESHILPSFIQEHVYDNFKQTIGEYMSFNDLFTLSAISLAVITTIVLFFYMILETKGETFAMICCIPFVLVVGIAVVVYIATFSANPSSVPTLGDLLPESVAVKIIVIVASFLLTAIASFLLCELTVKKTATKEI